MNSLALHSLQHRTAATQTLKRVERMVGEAQSKERETLHWVGIWVERRSKMAANICFFFSIIAHSFFV